MKIQQDAPAIVFVPATPSGTKVDGKYPSFNWTGTINGNQDTLEASATLNTKLLELGAQLGTGIAGVTIYIALKSFKTEQGEERKFWYVSTEPQETQKTPPVSKQVQKATIAQSVPQNAPQPQISSPTLQSRWINILALLKFVGEKEPIHVKVIQAFQMERLIRQGFKLQDEHGEVTANFISDKANSPEHEDIEKTITDLYGKAEVPF